MGYFELALGLLFLLALIDLSVGVSNDAVNFLNSAIGSRVTSRRIILIIASLGVLAGSLLSSGIMEVARKGIFNPEMFVFADVMVIFLAVMLADVLLLDLFNTMGLPTSTTVSIVFELLGAATAVALLVVMSSADGGSFLAFINVKSALLIITGIGLSIVLAFGLGTLVQFFSRLLFTFQEKNHTAPIRIVWSAIAFTVITYFIVVKALKGASFVTPDDLVYLYDHLFWLTLLAFVVWLAVTWVANKLGVDLISAVVLAGTFSLAMAFASNDLVNFIGVPLAGLSAWEAWSGSGIPPDIFTMDALTEPVRGNTGILLAAGTVMVVTLWLSSKARTVTQTEVDLGRQGEGAERFEPGPVSRGLVRAVITTGDVAMRGVPERWRTGLADRFARERAATIELDRPAFDTLRASVNLTVASILIVFATSLKLPLSTTFVSFMVAMGTSLADRAWGRDAAVYRIAGVFSVLGGWLLTALGAFTIAALFATLIKLFGIYAVVGLMTAATLALIHTHRYHARRTRMERLMAATSPDRMDRDALTLQRHFVSALQRNAAVLDRVVDLLIDRDHKTVRRLRAALKSDVKATRRTESEFVRRLNQVKPEVEPWLMRQLDVLARERELLSTATALVELAGDHVLNEHTPPTEQVATSLATLKNMFQRRFSSLTEEDGPARKRGGHEQDVEGELDRLTNRVLQDLYSGTRSNRNTTLLLGIVLEMRDLHRGLARAAAWQ